MFETYGAEVLQVQAADPRCVWTLADCDGREYVMSGLHIVNRIGYFIAALPFDGVSLEFPLCTDEEHAETEAEAAMVRRDRARPLPIF
jgi:hypothetical protein